MSRPSATEESQDGRTQRAIRSRRAIVAAIYRLVGDGALRPTAQEVAEEAGVGIRTVFRHFEDMEGLHAAMSARVASEALALLLAGEPSGDLRARCRGMVDCRIGFFEKIAPYKRSGALYRWASEYLQREHSRMVRGLRIELCRWLPEVEKFPDEVAAAIELIASFEAWDRLRVEQRLGRERARAVVERATVALLESAISAGSEGRGAGG